MEQSLFIDSTLTFEKVAAEAALPEDPNVWPNEILQELYRQVPYISDFDPHVVMDRVDAERGFAFGHVEVVNKSEIQRGVDPQAQAAAGIKQARIPIIVKNRKLQPFDILVTEDSKMLPLTETRLRQAVFRPQAFDVTSQTPGDMSMIGQLYPPYRQNYGFGGGGATMGVGMGKQGSALLSAILPTIHPKDYSGLFDKLASQQLQAAYVANAPGTAPALVTLSKYVPLDEMKIAASIYGDAPADVVQVAHIDDGYAVKRANHNMWAPFTEAWDRGRVVRAFGEKVALAADLNGSVTMAEGTMGAEMPEADTPDLIKEFGVYKVQDEKGRHLIGYVFPNLIDTDGQALPICLFTNGSQAAVQGEIAGVNIGGGASLFEGHPRGHGAFYQVLPNGRAQCTIPLTIQASLTDQGEESMSAETYDGRPVTVLIQPNIEVVTEGGDGHMLIPTSMRWLPLSEAETVTLVEDPTGFQKAASAKSSIFSVEIRSGGEDSFSISGLPLEKVAYEDKNFLDFDKALFLLAGLGVEPSFGVTKLSMAYGSHSPVEVATSRALTPASEQIARSEKRASALDALVRELRVDLVKEAAIIPDPVAVDTVLSLGFINPENLQTFISYLPKIDESQSKLCELLVAARLGMRDLPVSALEKAIRATEEVIDGLHVIAFGNN